MTILLVKMQGLESGVVTIHGSNPNQSTGICLLISLFQLVDKLERAVKYL